MKKIILLSLIITWVSCKKKHDEEPRVEDFRFTSKTVLGTCDKYLVTMIKDSTNLYLVGNFTSMGGVASNSIIIYDDLLQKFVPYHSNVSGAVYSFLPGKIDYIGGAKFDLNASSSAYCLASKSSSSTVFEPRASNLTVNGSDRGVSVIKKLDNEIYFAGDLKMLNGSTSFAPFLKLAGDSAYSLGGNNNLPGPAHLAITDMAKIGNTFYFSREFTDYVVWESSNGGDWEEVAPNTFNFGHNGASNLEVINYVLYASSGRNVVSLGTDKWSSSAKWERVGLTELPNLIYDIEYHNGVLYASGINFLYALDPETNEWKSVVDASLNLGELVKICFVKEKCYALESDENYQYRLVRFNVN